ncbi:hypothetical protein NDA01_18425 [Trichocoleus desertorum AS-A10]
MVESLVYLTLRKSAEVVFGLLLKKFWEWAFSDRNLKCSSNYLKMQLLILYLDWVLLKTPLKSLPPYSEEDE